MDEVLGKKDYVTIGDLEKLEYAHMLNFIKTGRTTAELKFTIKIHNNFTFVCF